MGEHPLVQVTSRCSPSAFDFPTPEKRPSRNVGSEGNVTKRGVLAFILLRKFMCECDFCYCQHCVNNPTCQLKPENNAGTLGLICHRPLAFAPSTRACPQNIARS